MVRQMRETVKMEKDRARDRRSRRSSRRLWVSIPHSSIPPPPLYLRFLSMFYFSRIMKENELTFLSIVTKSFASAPRLNKPFKTPFLRSGSDSAASTSTSTSGPGLGFRASSSSSHTHVPEQVAVTVGEVAVVDLAMAGSDEDEADQGGAEGVEGKGAEDEVWKTNMDVDVDMEEDVDDDMPVPVIDDDEEDLMKDWNMDVGPELEPEADLDQYNDLYPDPYLYEDRDEDGAQNGTTVPGEDADDPAKLFDADVDVDVEMDPGLAKDLELRESSPCA
jgi:hypothetical protein